ncbi:hypothetical protein WT01_31310 [Burkholderia cepacia]|nr:hypothetical protein WT01_31310 [Burkholderia cepacia]
MIPEKLGVEALRAFVRIRAADRICIERAWTGESGSKIVGRSRRSGAKDTAQECKVVVVAGIAQVGFQ